MQKILVRHYQSPIGELTLGALGNQLCLCDWRHRKMRAAVDGRIQRRLAAQYAEGDAEVLDETISQLEEYFQHSRRDFSIPVLLAGSDFQKRVWEGLRAIPFGGTLSYLQLAEKLGDGKAVRAVAAANGANALSIIVPCHRIIGANGNLVGYAGGLRAKRMLLELESDLFTLEAPPG